MAPNSYFFALRANLLLIRHTAIGAASAPKISNHFSFTLCLGRPYTLIILAAKISVNKICATICLYFTSALSQIHQVLLKLSLIS